MDVFVHNTMTNRKELFKPVKPDKVTMYTCGPTVYNYIHLGNARALVLPDIMKRFFRFLGYKVTHVQNITDVDDKIIDKANKEGVDFKQIAQRYTEAYFEDIQALGCQLPDVSPKASEHIDGMIQLVSELLEQGYAYQANGDVWFSVDSFSKYGQLSGQNLSSLQAGARVNVEDAKRNPFDFVLWKGAKPNEPYWESPWGKGRPGWHIECSVMSAQYLGQPFDIHTGGIDLIFPHHENELAQSEAGKGQPLANYWLHNGYINVNGQKMAKSTGNFLNLRDLFRRYEAPVVRLFLISKAYRSPIEFSEEIMESTQKGYLRLVQAMEELTESTPDGKRLIESDPSWEEDITNIYQETEQIRLEFLEGMADDFNTSIAVAGLFDLARLINRDLSGVKEKAPELIAHVLFVYRELLNLLGIEIKPRMSGYESKDLADSLMQLIIRLRTEARKRKDYSQADAIRDHLAELGIHLEDGPEGTRWKMNPKRVE
jgi:cysteinyl-tRNA synthetase